MQIVSLGQIFSDDQLRTAELCLSVDELREKVVEPHIAEINARLGQENDVRFLAYLLAAALMEHGWPFRREGES